MSEEKKPEASGTEMVPPVAPPPAAKKAAPKPAVREVDPDLKVQAGALVASWGKPVRRVFTARARRAALRQYKKNPAMTKVELEAAIKDDPDLVGLDPATILALITLIWKLYQFWQSRKAQAADIPEDPEDPRAIEDPILESENDGVEMV